MICVALAHQRRKAVLDEGDQLAQRRRHRRSRWRPDRRCRRRMPGMGSVPSSTMPCSISMISAGCGFVAGLMQTIPATSGCCKRGPQREAAAHREAATTTLSVRAASAGPPRPRRSSPSRSSSSCPPRSCRGREGGAARRRSPGGERLGHSAWRSGCREAMQAGAPQAAVHRPGLGAGQQLEIGHGLCLADADRRWTLSGTGRCCSGSSHHSCGEPAFSHSGNG